MKFNTCIALLLLLSAPPGQSQTPPSEVFLCIGNDDSDVDNILASIQYALTALPGVPPEENQYLESESKAVEDLPRLPQRKLTDAEKGQWIARSMKLHERPLYSVWRVRQALERTNTLASIVTHSYGDDSTREAKKLRNAISALGSAENYTQQVTEYLTRDEYRAVPVLSIEQRQRIYEGTISIEGGLERYMDCKLTKVMKTLSK